jgi:hypothetical protein
MRIRLALPVFGPDGDALAALLAEQGRTRAQLLRLDRANECRNVGLDQPPRQAVATGAFDPVSGLLITGEAAVEGQAGALRVYDITRARAVAALPLENVWSLAIHPKGTFMLCGHGEGAYLWPVRRPAADRLVIGPPRLVFSGAPITSISLDATGSRAVLGGHSDSDFAVLDLSTPVGADSRNMCAPEPVRIACAMGGKRVRVSPDGHWAVTSEVPGAPAEVWDLAAGVREFQIPFVFAEWVCFAADDVRFWTGGGSGARLWRAAPWRCERWVPGDFSGEFRLLPQDARLITQNIGNSIRLFDGATLEEVAVFEPPLNFASTGHAVSSDNRWLVQFTNRAGVLLIWDLQRVHAGLCELNLSPRWNTPTSVSTPAPRPTQWYAEFEP